MSHPNPFLRDEDGLLASIPYVRKENGGIDWRKMIPPQYLYCNKDFKDELLTRFNANRLDDIDVSKVPDYQLLVKIGGWQELLRLRGVKSVRFPILTATETYASATCEIQFTGNFETNGIDTIHSATAGASVHNVGGKFQLFLECMAENRAFARCVRTFLNVPIYGGDEFDPEMNAEFLAALKRGENPLISAPKSETAAPVTDPLIDPNTTEQLGLLINVCRQRKNPITFEVLKATAISKTDAVWVSNPSDWTGFDPSIPPLDLYTLTNMIQEADKERAKKTAKVK